MTYSEIRNALLASELDQHLTHLASDVRARRENVRAKTTLDARQALHPGAIITVQNLSPAYINGQKATVVKVNKTRAVVRFNAPEAAGRFGGKDVTVPSTASRSSTKATPRRRPPPTPAAAANACAKAPPSTCPTSAATGPPSRSGSSSTSRTTR